MLVNDCIELVKKNYPEPQLLEWHPSDYDMKYRYNTPRRLKKLDAVKSKEDAKLKDLYDKQMMARASVFSIINEIATYPTEIANLFLDTFKWSIDSIIQRHEAYLKAKEDTKIKFGDSIAEHMSSLKYLLEETHYNSGHYKTWVLADVEDEKWDKFCNQNCAPYYKEFAKVPDRKELFKAYKELKELREADDVSSYGAEAYPMAIKHMACTLKRIATEIDAAFDGKKPTECLTDVDWGVNGKFNGILTDGTAKVSFKSFSAGGYNIQRYHYRFKVTKLK